MSIASMTRRPVTASAHRHRPAFGRFRFCVSDLVDVVACSGGMQMQHTGGIFLSCHVI